MKYLGSLDSWKDFNSPILQPLYLLTYLIEYFSKGKCSGIPSLEVQGHEQSLACCNIGFICLVFGLGRDHVNMTKFICLGCEYMGVCAIIL